MRCNAFVEAWKNHHRRASMILGLSLLAAPLSYAVYAEDGVSKYYGASCHTNENCERNYHR